MRNVNASLVGVSMIGCLIGCGGGPSSGPVEVALSATAPEIAVRTQSKSELAQVVVTVSEIHASLPGDGSMPVLLAPKQIDLLKLDGKTLANLGVATLPAGRVCQLLLRVTDGYVVLKSGQKLPLDLPENGIVKVTGDLKLEACATGTVIVDFDAKITVDHGKHSLRCSAHIKTQKTKGSCGGTSSDGGTTPQPDQGGGSCTGVVCGPGEVCQGGMCVSDPCAGVVCAPTEVCQAGTCVPKDPCMGVICQPSETCNDGMCVPNSPPDMGDHDDDGPCDNHCHGSHCKK
jgi:hypothetical protein